MRQLPSTTARSTWWSARWRFTTCRRGRAREALREAARVLKKGGKLAIADIRHTQAYARELEACGLKITDRRSLGVRFWYVLRPLGGNPPGRRDQAVDKGEALTLSIHSGRHLRPCARRSDTARAM